MGVHLELLGISMFQHPYIPFDFSPFPVTKAFRQRLGIFPACNSHPRTESYNDGGVVREYRLPKSIFSRNNTFLKSLFT